MESDQTNLHLVAHIAIIRHIKKWRQRGSAKQPKDPQKALEAWLESKHYPIAVQKIIDEVILLVTRFLLAHGPQSDQILTITLEVLLEIERRGPGRPRFGGGLISRVLKSRKRQFSGRPLAASLEEEKRWINSNRGFALGLWATDELLPASVSAEKAAAQLVSSSKDEAEIRKVLASYFKQTLSRGLHENPPAKTPSALVKRARRANASMDLPKIIKKGGG